MSAHGIAIIYTLRRFYIFMRRTNISHFSFLIQSRLSNVIKGQHAPGLTLRPLFSSPHEVIRQSGQRRGEADAAIHERIAESLRKKPEECGGKSDTDIQRPEISRCRDARAGRRRAADRDGLEGRRQRTEADPQDRRGEEQEERPLHLQEEEKARREEKEARIHRIVRAMVIKEVADKWTGYDDGERKDQEEETRIRAYPKASRIQGNECQDTAVGKKDKSA